MFAVAAIWLAAGPILTAGRAGAATITVRPDGSGEHPTIQAAIDAAAAGDVVLLAPGTYTGPGNRNLDFRGKAITVRGQAGAENTIIDCQSAGRGFSLHSGEGPDSVTEGLTLTKGFALKPSGVGYYGGGILCEGASPTISSCTVKASQAYAGGGIACQNGRLVVDGCRIESNTASNGGGIFCRAGGLTISDSLIENNQASGCTSAGGGIYLDSSSASSITRCTIRGNIATYGGGLACSGGTLTILDSVFESNRSQPVGPCIILVVINPSGGAISSGQCHLILEGSIFGGNSAGSNGGAINFSAGELAVNRCLFVANTATSGGAIRVFLNGSTAVTNGIFRGNFATRGGALSCLQSELNLLHCTLNANFASQGRGIFFDTASPAGSLRIRNSILADGGDEILGLNEPAVAVGYSNIAGGWPGEGNIDADPSFAFAQDEHLLAGSPCIDSGQPDPAGEDPPTDLDGNVRSLDGNGDGVAAPDMGAYEFNGDHPSIALSATHIKLVARPPDPPPLGMFSIRNCGGGTLHWDITQACDWLEVLPAAGDSAGGTDEVTLTVDPEGLELARYTCELRVRDDEAVNSPRTVTVELRTGDELYVPLDYPTIQAAMDAASDGDVIVVGARTYTGPGNTDLDPHGKAITIRSERGPAVTFIDGQGLAPAFRFESGETANCIMEGFTIRVSGGSQTTTGDGPGGVVCTDSSPTIRNCRIVGQDTDRMTQSGIHCVGGSATIVDCTLTGIRAYQGGGIHFEGGAPTVIRCEIGGNSASLGGGVWCGAGTTVSILDCIIRDNWGYQGGGGLFLSGGSSIMNCRIINNSGYAGGGVVCQSDTIQECEISGNQAGMGGGISSDLGQASVIKCRITRNQAVYCGGGLSFSSPDGAPEVTDCTIAANRSSRDGGGVYRNRGNLVLTDCLLVANSAQGLGGGICCQPRSHAGVQLFNCLLTANSSSRGGGVHTGSLKLTTFANTILWSNVDTGGMDESAQVDGAAPAVSYSCIQGWTGAFGGAGNIGANPRFIRLPTDGGDGWGDDPDTPDVDESANDDYGDLGLRGRSPCIDAGDSAAVPAGIVTDLAGGPRFIDDPATPDTGQSTAGLAVVDMGPYEFDPGADDDADGFANGQDNCSGDPNPDQADADGDTAGDVCDNCRWSPNPDQHDADDDGIGDGCDACPATIPGIAVDDEGCPPAIPGDLDRDGDIDAADAGIFLGCLTGPNAGPPDPACTAADLDADHDVDQSDFGRLQPCLTAPDVPADPACGS